MLELEHNTIDIINENYKLKEILNFWTSNFSHDQAALEEKINTQKKEIEEQKQKMKNDE